MYRCKKIPKGYDNTRSDLDTSGEKLYVGGKKQLIKDEGLEGKNTKNNKHLSTLTAITLLKENHWSYKTK
jgi:hypothetical protein